MSLELLGGPVASSIQNACRTRADALADRGVVARLAVVLAGDDPGSRWYARSAARRLEACGCETSVFELDGDVTQKAVERLVSDLSADDSVHGILVMRPLPPHIDEAAVAALVAPEKDVDAVSPASVAALAAGDPGAFAPCTAAAVMRLLDHYGFECRGATACVVGRSATVGRPVAQLLLARDATVTVCHSRTRDLAASCRAADLVVTCQGRPGSITADMVVRGAWVVDVGTSEAEDGSLVGDVDWGPVFDRAHAATPVPRGVGSVTTAVLAEHVIAAAERSCARRMRGSSPSDHGNPAIAQLFERKSVRAFADVAVEPELRASVLAAACQAPSAGNQQLYSIIQVDDPEMKARLAELCDDQPFIARAPWVLVFAADCRIWPALYAEAGVKGFRAPGVGDLMLAVTDAVICAQNAVVAAHSLGLGSCYIGDVMERKEEVSRLLGLPDYVFPAAMLVLGFPTPQQLARPKPGRAPLDVKVMEDGYEELSGERLRALVGDRTGAKGFDEWVRAFCARKHDSAFSREMTRSVAAYLESFDRTGEARV
ncbi:tetrahydrofolate dehydrogenase/cyclohydrolase catalytic domain-containing protein [Atopobiaceae bacterium 24-176]